MTASRRVVVLVGLAIALVVPLIGPTRFLPPVPGAGPLYVREWFWWALLLLVLLYVVVVERRPLSSIGFKRPSLMSFVWGFLAAAVSLIGLGLILAFVAPALGLKLNQGAMNAILQTPLWYRVALVTRAAFVEETLFRGYGIERLQELTGNRWLAGFITWATFTVAHVGHWGWAALFLPAWAGLVLTGVYLWRRDLASNITAHWLFDAAGFLLPHP